MYNYQMIDRPKENIILPLKGNIIRVFSRVKSLLYYYNLQ
jgi:hypothetical protein